MHFDQQVIKDWAHPLHAWQQCAVPGYIVHAFHIGAHQKQPVGRHPLRVRREEVSQSLWPQCCQTPKTWSVQCQFWAFAVFCTSIKRIGMLESEALAAAAAAAAKGLQTAQPVWLVQSAGA